MSTLYVVLPLALLISAGAVLAFYWSVRRGQLDDLETPAHRILFDDEQRVSPPQDPVAGSSQDPSEEPQNSKPSL